MSSCRYFSGYKPCGKSPECGQNCSSFEAVEESILLIHLGALGAVVRSTSLLEGLRAKHPRAKIMWLTDKPADKLIQGHPLIDAVWTTDMADLIQLRSFEFSVIYTVDKSLKAIGCADFLRSQKRLGFISNPKTGAILPATAAAEELWQLGLNNHQKFFVNKKSEVQLMYEALELGTYSFQDYNLPLATHEVREAHHRRHLWSEQGEKILLGINTGCSPVIPYKKLTVSYHRELIQKILLEFPHVEIVLLGGPEDFDRNQEIAQGLPVIVSDCKSGLRDGLVSVAACDILITGDSLGMHMGISQKKHVIAWFGPTCAHEIELYGRGEALLSEAPCAPCWKRSCQKETMCYDLVSYEAWLQALRRGIASVSNRDNTDGLSRGSSPQHSLT